MNPKKSYIAAAVADDLDKMQAAIDSGADMEDPYRHLLGAISTGEWESIKAAVDAGPNKTEYATRALMVAIGQQKFEIASKLINTCTYDFDCSGDAKILVPILCKLACKLCNSFPVTLLLNLAQRGVNLHSVDVDDKLNVLQIAATAGRLDLVNTFLQVHMYNSEILPFDVNVGADMGRTPLLLASAGAENIFFPKQLLLRKLLEAGSDVHAKDADGNTSLHLVVRCTVNGPQTDSILVLLSAGVNERAQNNAGLTAYDIAHQISDHTNASGQISAHANAAALLLADVQMQASRAHVQNVAEISNRGIFQHQLFGDGVAKLSREAAAVLDQQKSAISPPTVGSMPSAFASSPSTVVSFQSAATSTSSVVNTMKKLLCDMREDIKEEIQREGESTKTCLLTRFDESDKLQKHHHEESLVHFGQLGTILQGMDENSDRRFAELQRNGQEGNKQLQQGQVQLGSALSVMFQHQVQQAGPPPQQTSHTSQDPSSQQPTEAGRDLSSQASRASHRTTIRPAPSH